jgi:hypothetical protein
MEKRNGVNHSMQLSVIARRKNVIVRLESQVKSGLKPIGDTTMSLTSADKERINKELSILKARI